MIAKGMVHLCVWGLLAVFAAFSASAQGFAGMASDAEGFSLPRPNPEFSFPEDHGPHPDFRIEWWYVTANLTAEDGRSYGIQWTLFRSATRPEAPADTAKGWASPQIWFGHAGLTNADQHFTAQTFARGGIGQAGATAAPFAAWINDWAMTGRAGPGQDALDRLDLSAHGADFSYALKLEAQGPILRQGLDGYSVKSPRGQASYYYSQPHYDVQGTVHLPGGPVVVTGQAWLDREWSSQPLAPSQTGWDWFSLHLADGAKLMVYRLRDADGPDFIPASFVGPDGAARYLPDGDVELTPIKTTRVAGRDVPTHWRVIWADGGLDIETEPVNTQAWMDLNVPYWEGPVRVTGTHQGQGYLEMTGYE
ncbi:lipocalin-like domain-containing protein [Meridianimarinicoccus aquatilis]|uniref:Iron ABC transporter permease n=1 Tax=Meridianimarinicoccus aquatilis TaxID=2552766 RepID=A0A4R6B451_9RHOB|nr:lipocalin-like domain-containing protein [Fluviibacterium aquatile]TDL91124.1 iron ABC transporter permease [Fluviibacterium aquatile]